MEVVWSKLAVIPYKGIVINLHKGIVINLHFYWTLKEIKNFRDLTQNRLDKIKTQQISCPLIN